MLLQKLSSEQEVDDVARRALSKIIEFGMPLTPEGFAVWHGYFSGNFPTLRQNIDEKLDKGLKITAADTEDLYFRHLSSRSQDVSLDTASHALSSLMHDMIGQLSSATLHTSEFAEALDEFQHTLEDKKFEDAGSAVAQIIKKTREIRQEQTGLNSDINSATKSIVRLKKELESSNVAASRDELTQVSNWLSIHKELRLRAINSTEHSEPLSIVITDIDGFSNFNDQYGRDLGNSVLCLLAKILRDLVEDRGLVGRYGGDEFIVVMQGTSVNDAAIMTEELRQQLQKWQFRHKKTNKNYGTITVSAAIGEYEKGEAIANLIQRAAKALKVAKENGGNKISFAKRQISKSSVMM